MAQSSSKQLWTGRVLSALAVLFLTFDATMKLMRNPMAVAGTKQLGYPEQVVFTLGVIQAICLALYLIPRTAVLGAILFAWSIRHAIRGLADVDPEPQALAA